MAQLSTKIRKYLGRVPDFLNGEVVLQDDMVGKVSNPYIKEWNVEGVAEPTAEQLNAVESEADAQEALSTVIGTRRFQYPKFIEFAEAYTEKEIGGNSAKWDAYVTKYNKVRADNPKP